MNSMQSSIQRNASRVLVTSILTFGAMSAALAASETPADSAPAAVAATAQAGEQGKQGMERRGGRHGGDHHKAEGREKHGKHQARGDRQGMRKLLRGLDLTEVQRDKIFELRHASMPAMRDAHKAVRVARKALRDYTAKGAGDKAQLQTYADQLGQAISAMAVLRVQGMQDVMAQLSDEQVATVRDRLQKRGMHGHGKHSKGEQRRDGHEKNKRGQRDD